MKASIVLLFALCLCACKQTEPSNEAHFLWFEYQGHDERFEETLKPEHYLNPIIPGFYPDPSIIRVDHDYYLVTSSFAYFPGLPIFHSHDLVNWQQIGHALTRRSQATFENGQGISRGIFAPTLRYHDGLFYIISTDVDGIGNFIITASKPAGPWSDPILLPEIDGIDPDIFFDDDGRVFIAHNGAPEGEALYQGHRAIWLWEYDLKNKKLLSDSARVIVNGGVDLSQQPIWIEAPHIYKINGWYYLSCAEGGTADDHSQVIFRSRSLDEPFIPYENNPILTQRDLPNDRDNPITSTGHADFVQTAEGEWWAVFLGVRPWRKHGDLTLYHNTGRETFLLPVTWENEWPHILPANTEIAKQTKAPKIALREGPTVKTKNAKWRDNFDTASLKQEWVKVRTSATQWHHLDEDKQALTLQALPISLNDNTQAAYLGRRQQHLHFSAQTEVALMPNTGVSAGLVLFQSSDFHYFFGVKKVADGYALFLETVNAGKATQEALLSLATTSESIILSVEQNAKGLDFYIIDSEGKETLVAGEVDASLLSTQKAGGFVGATVGVHTRLD